MTHCEQAVYQAALVLLECDGLLACDRQTSEALEALRRAVAAAKRDDRRQELLPLGGTR